MIPFPSLSQLYQRLVNKPTPQDSEKITQLRYADEQFALFKKLVADITSEKTTSDEIAQMKRHLDAARQPIERYQNRAGQAHIMYYEAVVTGFEKNWEAAKEKLFQASSLYRQIDNLLGEANCLFHLGLAYAYQNSFEVAIQMFAEAAWTYGQLNLPEGQQYARQNRAAFTGQWLEELRDAEQNDKAIEVAQDAVEWARQENMPRYEASFLSEQAIAHNNKKNYTEALRLFHVALEIFTQLELKDHEISTFSAIAYTYSKQKRYEEAKKCYLWCLEVALKLELTTTGGIVYYNWAQMYEDQEDYDNAIFLMTKAQETLTDPSYHKMQQKMIKFLREWREKLEERAKAASEESPAEPRAV